MAKIPINKFDQFVRDKMEMHKTPVDTDRLWTNIQQESGRRKTGVIPGFFLLLAVAFFTGIQMLNQDTNESQIAQATLISKSMDGFELVPAGSDNRHQLSKPSSAAFLSETDLAQSPQTNTPVKSYPNNSKHNHIALHTGNDSEEDISGSSTSLGFNPLSIASKNKASNADLAETLASNQKNEPIPAAASEIALPSIEEESAQMKAQGLARIQTDIAALVQVAELFPVFEKLDWKQTIRVQRQSKGLQLRLQAGAGMVFRQMTLLNPEASQWMQKRMDNEYLNESVRVGMDIRVNLNRNVYFFAGLEDFRINERFEYLDVIDRTYLGKGHIANVVYDADSRKEEIGSREVREIITKSGTFYNQYRMINIPLGAGISKSIGRFSLGAEAAVLVNVHHEFDGKMADSQNELVDMQDMAFRVSQLQTVRLNAMLAYRLSPRFSLNLSSGADLSMKGIKLGDYMEQNYTVWQSNLGICYHW